MKAFRLSRILIVILLVLMAAAACSKKDPVESLIADLKEAAEARDVKGIESRLALDFSGNEGFSREETLNLLRRYFAAYERISLDVTNVDRTESGDRLSFRVAFSGQPNTAFGLQSLFPSSAAYSFALRLVEEGDTLKVRNAVWREAPGF